VNPAQGTDSIHTFSTGNTLPLTSAPFGMTSWSPQTDEGRWFFHPRLRQLQGIRATHQPCPWIGDYGNFVLMPQVGRLFLESRQRASSFRPDHTVIKPHYFRTYLGRYKTTVELTPTERCAMMRLSFPVAENDLRLILQPVSGESSVTIDVASRCVTGWSRGNSGGVPANFAIHYAIRFDCDLDAHASGVFGTEAPQEGVLEGQGERMGAYIGLVPNRERVVHVRIGTSFISVEQAFQNLDAEVGDDGFDKLLARMEEAWLGILGQVRISGASERQLRTFYSCFYRASLFPRMFYEYTAAGEKIHYSPYDGRVHPGPLYADNGFWDTHRTVYSFLSIFMPSRLGEILEGWVNAYREGGWFPKWSSPGYQACMIGTHMDAVIADGVVKGIPGFDVETAYAGLLRDATEKGAESGAYGRRGIEAYLELGYVPADEVIESASRTQDFAYNDFCVAQVAKALGRDDDYRRLVRRAFNYRNVYDPEVGFMRGRNRDGSWEAPFDPFRWGGPYVEGSAWQCSWAVNHDPAGLIEIMGGRKAFIAKLDQLMATPPHFEVGTYNFEIHEMTEMAAVDFGQYAHSNQPSHHLLYLYAAAGMPSRTQYWVRKVLEELYSPEDDGFAGDEDNGEMSAWYILSAMGIYPLCPGHPSYVLGSPLFRKMKIRLGNGQKLKVKGRGNRPERVYVESVRLNGKTHRKLFLTHEQLMGGGTLEFQMSDEPRDSGDYPADALPYSLSHECPETE
jgi:predicted alpha-1,2-mannosidase